MKLKPEYLDPIEKSASENGFFNLVYGCHCTYSEAPARATRGAHEWSPPIPSGDSEDSEEGGEGGEEGGAKGGGGDAGSDQAASRTMPWIDTWIDANR